MAFHEVNDLSSSLGLLLFSLSLNNNLCQLFFLVSNSESSKLFVFAIVSNS
jgi:hypothetical protein